MQPQNPSSIAYARTGSRAGVETPLPRERPGRAAAVLALAALGAGGLAAAYFWAAGLTLAHYDARAHLVVARRIFDSLTPGWQQIGAVWLPLPHLLNAVPVQIDVLYRTGASAIAFSVASLSLTVWALARYTIQATGSIAAAAVSAAALLFNPNVLYLTATPMTELLLVGLSALALALTADVLRLPDRPGPRHKAGLVMAAACLVRYEAWPVTTALIGLSAVAGMTAGVPRGLLVRRAAAMTVYPVAAIVLFLGLGKATTGEWLVSSGFFEPETLTTGRVLRSGVAVWWGTHHLTGYPAAIAGAVGLLAASILGLRPSMRKSGHVFAPSGLSDEGANAAAASARDARPYLRIEPLRRRQDPGGRALVLAGALAAAAVLPWYAFYAGHPFRFRYMVPLVPAVALGLGLLVGIAGRWRGVVAALAMATVLLGPRPLDPDAPVVRESQLDTTNSGGRRAVTAYLELNWDGQPVLASMGSLAHYMHELSSIGFRIRDFVHEGNGALWERGVASPEAGANWILMEEASEGGDLLAVRARSDPSYLRGFERVAEGGNVALYRRAAPGRPKTGSGRPTGR